MTSSIKTAVSFLTTALVAPLVATGIVACGSEDAGSAVRPATELSPNEVRGPTMRPGDNCLRCHSETGNVGAPVWSAGGTVYARKDTEADEGVSGVIVTITDADGRVLSLVTNAAGNFYTRQPLTKPYRVAIEYGGKRKEMPIAAPAGSCNACHSWPDPSGGAPGRIHLP